MQRDRVEEEQRRERREEEGKEKKKKKLALGKVGGTGSGTMVGGRGVAVKKLGTKGVVRRPGGSVGGIGIGRRGGLVGFSSLFWE